MTTSAKHGKIRPVAKEPKPRVLKVEDSGLAKWYILGAVIQDERSRMIHSQVAWPILEHYFRATGSGRASYRFLATATGLTHGSIKTATADLVDWGYFTREVGSGKAATTYVPNWEAAKKLFEAGPLSVLQPQSALQPPSALPLPSALPSQNTLVLQPPSTTADSVLQPPNESLLMFPVTTGVNKQEEQTPALASALEGRSSGSPVPKRWTVIEASLQQDGDENVLYLLFDDGDPDGGMVERWIPLEGTDLSGEAEGQEDLDELLRCAGIFAPLESPEDFIGLSVWGEQDGDRIHYVARPEVLQPVPPRLRVRTPELANDNEPVMDVGPFSPFGTFRGEVITEAIDRSRWTLEVEVKNDEYDTTITNTIDFLSRRGSMLMEDLFEACGYPRDHNKAEDVLFVPIQVAINERFAITYSPLPDAETRAA